MNVVSHIYHGLWRHPDTKQTEFNDLATWIELAKLLEAGKFDALFLADVIGVDPSYRLIVGTPETIADQLELWQDAGINGVNVMYQTTPGSFQTFIEHVMPELRRRGLAQREYSPGTLRQRLFPGRPARLIERHPAARYRGAFAHTSEPAASLNNDAFS